MNKKILAIGIVITLILSITLLFYPSEKPIEENRDYQRIEETNESEEADNDSENGNDINYEEDEEKEDGEELPDFSKKPCGYYYEEYGVCDGNCPDGECMEEGDSCYCQQK